MLNPLWPEVSRQSPEDMGAFVMACGKIREQLRTHVLVVHHAGKDTAKGARGHSSLRAATDVEIEVTAEEDKTHLARVTKHRDGPQGDIFGFKLDVVELRKNTQDVMITTCVAAHCEVADRASQKNKTQGRTGKDEALALRALQQAIDALGVCPPSCDETRNVALAVTIDQWRNYFRHCYGNVSDDKTEQAAFRQSWSRGRRDSISSGRAKVWGDLVWLP